MNRDETRQDRKVEWFASLRDPDWQLELPTTVANVVRQNPIGAGFFLMIMCFFGVGFAIGALRLPTIVEVPIGIAAGVGAWWLLMFAFAKGWVQDE